MTPYNEEIKPPRSSPSIDTFVPKKTSSMGNRIFRLNPYPFAEPSLTLTFPARHVTGKTFATSADLQHQFTNTPIEHLTVTIQS